MIPTNTITGTSTTTTGYFYVYPKPSVCPTCGTCPTCGRQHWPCPVPAVPFIGTAPQPFFGNIPNQFTSTTTVGQWGASISSTN